MATKVDVTLAMTEEDMAFLVRALDFVEGGLDDTQGLLGYWRVTFRRLLEEHYPEAHGAEDDDQGA